MDSSNIRLYNQNGYLVAKIRKEGKLYTISSGIKIPKGCTWHSKTQILAYPTILSISHNTKTAKLLTKIEEAKKDIYKRIEIFRLTNNPSAIRLKKVKPQEEIKTVLQAIEIYKKATKKNQNIVACLEHQFKTYKGSKKIDNFNIQDFYNSIKIKASSKNTYITVLNMILKKTINKDSEIEKEREPKKSPMILDEATEEKIESSTHKHSSVIRLLLYTGIRSGELPNLMEAYKKNPNSDRIKYIMPKTQTERVIPLTGRIKKEILTIKKPPKYKTLWKYFHDSYSINLHVLRATFITMAYRNGRPAEIISKAVGHSNVNTTIQFYTHFLDEEIFEVFE